MRNLNSDVHFGKQLNVYGPTTDLSSCNSTLLSELSTDELLEKLPDNLHLARNSNAPDHDKWRIFNSVTSKYIEPGFDNPKALLIHTIEKLEKQRRDWTGR